MAFMPPGHDPYAALRHPDYRRVLAGSVLASVGGQMQSVAIGWELWGRTHDALALGYVGLVQFLPVLLLSLPAGQVADQHSRKVILAIAQTVTAVASLCLAALSWFVGPLFLIYVCLAVVGIARAFNQPARWALVPQVVPDDTLTNAVTWNSSGWQIASLVGPALGGLVIGVTGLTYCVYVFAACCALICAVLVAGVRPRFQARSRGPLSFTSLLAGIRFVWNTKLILATITLDLFAVLLGGAAALLPIYCSEDYLDIGPTGLGWLRAAPSFGAFLMALTLAHRPPLRRAGLAMLLAVGGFGAATIVFGLSRNASLSFAMLAVTGALDNISVVVRGTLVQVLTPDPMRGRVSAVNTIFIASSNELGDFESGLTAKWFGPVISVVGGGIGTVLVVLLVGLAWPQVLRLGPLTSVAAKRPGALPDTESGQLAVDEPPCGGERQGAPLGNA